MNSTILSTEIVRAVHHSPDTATNLAEVVKGMIDRENNPQPVKTLRDEFAMAVICGMSAINDQRYFVGDQKDAGKIDTWRDECFGQDAKQAYRVADAMLAARQ